MSNPEQAGKNQDGNSKAIAFLGYREFDGGGAYRGAVLVIDEWGKPIEFRCTAPVRPTTLQRTLYGNSLLPHILTELIGAPLLAALREPPHLILLSSDDFMAVRHKVSVPVFKVTRPAGEVKQDAPATSKPLLLQSASGKFVPVEVLPHWKFVPDLDASNELLRELFGRWDLTEPFQRLTEGLKYVHDQRVLEE